MTQLEVEAKKRYDDYMDKKFQDWYQTLPYRCTNTKSMEESFRAGFEEANRLNR